MRSLPQDLQGILHIIKIPEKQEVMPAAYMAYIRLQKSNSTQATSSITEDPLNHMLYLSEYDRSSLNPEECCDIIDNMIFTAICRKHPNATYCVRPAMYVEGLKKDIASFLGWCPNTIHIFPHTPINPQFAYTSDPQFEDIKLSLYTKVELDKITREVLRNIDKPEFYYWINMSDKYSDLFDIVYPLEFPDTNSINAINAKLKECPIKDLKDVLKEINNLYEK